MARSRIGGSVATGRCWRHHDLLEGRFWPSWLIPGRKGRWRQETGGTVDRGNLARLWGPTAGGVAFLAPCDLHRLGIPLQVKTHMQNLSARRKELTDAHILCCLGGPELVQELFESRITRALAQALCDLATQTRDELTTGGEGQQWVLRHVMISANGTTILYLRAPHVLDSFSVGFLKREPSAIPMLVCKLVPNS